jgi:succinate dehydrogenase/fumarate reductase cytochrome b subunit
MWKLNLSLLRGVRLKDYLIRFLFGGIISVLAALVAQGTTGRIGGIFTAFPAILLASLTLINQEDGKSACIQDAQGAVLGAVALVLASIVLSLTLGILAGIWALLLGLGAWLICSFGLYVLSVKAHWLHIDKKN